MATLDGLLGTGATNDSARQLFIWGVLYGLLSSVFLPVTTGIQQEAWKVFVDTAGRRALTPDELATMVVRGWLDQATAQEQAKESGIDNFSFDKMVNVRRNPISPEEAAVALRRQIIPFDAPPGQVSYKNAIQEGNLGEQWEGVVQALARGIPSPADVLQAYLEGQIPDGVDPRVLYQIAGGEIQDPITLTDWFDLMYNTRGSAPTPMEALTMLNRRIIPLSGTGPGVVSYEQAFLEGPWRNKWEQAFLGLREYFPPPRTIVAMLHNGSLDVPTAIDLLERQGLTPELANAYVADATRTKTAKPKELTVSMIEELFIDKLIDEPTAVTHLESLGYTATEANLVLKAAALRSTVQQLNANVNRIKAIYIAHRIDRTTAASMLGQLGLPAAQIDQYLTAWDIDRLANVKRLTPAQIVNAWYYTIMDQAEAQASLEADGYTPFDAWVLLSERNKAPLPNQPPPGPAPVQ